MKISYGKNVYSSKEINLVSRVLKNHGTQMSYYTLEFERKISKFFDKKYTCAVNSGSSALLLAFDALNFKKNSNFITPVLTFGTTISSMLKSGYKPNFVDINLKTLCIDEKAIINAIDNKTVGICVPNLIGNLPNWIVIKRIAKKYNLLIIEDSADTLGSKFNSKSTGFFSDISICSYYGSHIISCAGNGGSISVNDYNLFTKIKKLRSWGRDSSIFDTESENIENRFNVNIDNIDYDRKFIFSELGYNFEPSEIGCAFGIEQLKKLVVNRNKRKIYFNMHKEFFSDLSKYFILPKIYEQTDTAWLAYPVIIKKNNLFARKDLMIFLEENEIQTRVIFSGNILRQPAFSYLNKPYYKNKFKKADYIMEYGLLIACHHGLNIAMVKKIHYTIKRFISLL